MALVAVCVLAPASASAGTIDQEQLVGGDGEAVFASQSVGQTFTAGLTGRLDQVDLSLSKAAPMAPFTVEIRNVAGGFPGATVLATASLAPAAIPGVAAFVPVAFATPATVAAGTQYSIVASSTTPANDYTWTKSATPNSYAGGSLTIGPSPNNVMSLSSGDANFRTYVAPPVTTPPPAASTGERAAALKKCKKKKSKKAKKKCKKKANQLPV